MQNPYVILGIVNFRLMKMYYGSVELSKSGDESSFLLRTKKTTTRVTAVTP